MWHRNPLDPLWAVPLYALLLILDLGLFAASSTKFMDGGWLPVSIAAALTLIFATWRKGRGLINQRLSGDAMPVELFLKSSRNVHRVPSTAVYLTAARDGVPPALLHNMKANKVRHERILLVTVETSLTPRIDEEARIDATEIGDGITRVLLRFGFTESPDVPAALSLLPDGLDDGATFFLSRQTLIPSSRPGMALWREKLFAAMVRNAETPMLFFRLPPNRVVELGSQIEI